VFILHPSGMNMSIAIRIDGEKFSRQSCPNATSSAPHLTWAALRTNSSVSDERRKLITGAVTRL
jgi:hypothetical protein